MKTQHKCMSLAMPFRIPDAQPPPRLRARHTFALSFDETALNVMRFTPPYAIQQLTVTNLGGKAIWRDTSAPSPGQKFPSLNGHTVKIGALPKRAYRCFAGTAFKHTTRFTPAARNASWNPMPGTLQGAMRVAPYQRGLIPNSLLSFIARPWGISPGTVPMNLPNKL